MLITAMSVTALSAASAARAEPVRVTRDGAVTAAPRATSPTDPLGRQVTVLDEQPGAPLDLADVRERLARGQFEPSTVDVPNLGNRAPPRWLHLDIDNPGGAPLPYRIYVAEGWVDRIDVWLIGPDGRMQSWQAGDERSPAHHLRPGLGYAFDALLVPGRSELYVRADSIDAAAMPLRLLPLAQTAELEAASLQWIGLVHGFLFALVATYGLLWLALRERNLLRYVAYVGSYLGMHLAYSGIAARFVWPDAPGVARYAILVGMVLFSSAGLGFARGFLGLGSFAPRLDRVLSWTVRLALAAMAACVVLDRQAAAVSFAFACITLFTFAMVGLGALGLRHAREQSAVFFVATLFSAAGALATTLAVMGVIPLNAVTFRAVEVGVMCEASIWALALGLRLRRQQHDRAVALELARRDPLTGLDNRRGFFEQALPLYSTAARRSRPFSVVMLDLDHFKEINDAHGHATGDRALVEIGDRLRRASRLGDVTARWGGEEFVMLLPETSDAEARAMADRIRTALARQPIVADGGQTLAVTASFGVATRQEGQSLDELLRAADEALYAAKGAGRDRVVSAQGALGEAGAFVASGL